MSVYLSSPGIVSCYADSAAILINGGMRYQADQKWFDPQIHLPGRKSRYLSRATRYLLAAGNQTAQPWFGRLPDDRKGVVIGTNFADYPVRDEVDRRLLRDGSAALNSVQAPNVSINMPAAQTAIDHRCGGVCATLNTSDTAGIEALIYAKNAIDAKRADALIAGSTEDNGSDGCERPLLPQVLGGSCTFAVFSDHVEHQPAQPIHEIVAWHWRRYPPDALQDKARQPAIKAALAETIRQLLADRPPRIALCWHQAEPARPVLEHWLYQALDRARIDFEVLAPPPRFSPSYSGCNTPMLLLQFALLTSSRPLLLVATHATGSVVALYLQPRF